jgi:pimeloyl-ACP methyl ester carboxylesterase
VALAGDGVYLHGTSSGAALALEAAKHIRPIVKLAVYEPPFIVDDTRTPMPDDWLPRLKGLLADGRRGDAVKMFMRFVGTPAIFTAVMPFTPVWGKLKAVAPTLPYDLTIMHEHQGGRPLTSAEWATVKVPTLVAAGAKSPVWMTNGTRALAGALPDATYRTLPGQNHMVKAQAIAPLLTEFFTAGD